MAKKIKQKIKIKRKRALVQKGQEKEQDLEILKENLEKTGEALGDLFKGVFKGVGKILDVAQEMEKKGEETRIYQKEIRGVTENGKEFQGEAGWKISTGLLKLFGKKKEEKEGEGK